MDDAPDLLSGETGSTPVDFLGRKQETDVGFGRVKFFSDLEVFPGFDLKNPVFTYFELAAYNAMKKKKKRTTI